MGWTSFHKPANFNAKEFLKKEMENEFWCVADIAIVNVKEAYIAYENKKSKEVHAMIVLLDYRDDDFYYKVMDEGMIPFYFNCPERILNKLTERQNEYANDWRAKCRAVIDKKKKFKTLKSGDMIRLEKPLEFTDGTVYDTFFIFKQGRSIMYIANGMRYRLPNLSQYEYTIYPQDTVAI